MPTWLKRALPPVLTFILLTAAAEIVIRLSGVKAYLLPPPSMVFEALWEERVALWQASKLTATAAVLGFGLSAVAGGLVAMGLSASRWVQRAFYPYAVFFQTVPIIAIAPLLVIWFGYGMRSVVAAAFVVAIFPVIANTLTGLLSTEPALCDLFRLYGASRWSTLWKLKIPSALPSIFTGLRIAAGLAVIGTIVGEFISGGGLGIVVQTAIKEQRSDLIFATVLLASLVGVAMFAGVNLAGWLLLRHWHASAR